MEIKTFYTFLLEFVCSQKVKMDWDQRQT